MNQDCIMHKSDTQNGYLNTLMQSMFCLTIVLFIFCWWFVGSLVLILILMKLFFFSTHLSVHPTLIYSGCASGCCCGEHLWTCLHCVSLRMDLLPA